MASRTSFLTFFHTTLWLDHATNLAIVDFNTSYFLRILASIVLLLLIKFGVNSLKKHPSLSASLRDHHLGQFWVKSQCNRLGNVHVISMTSPELAQEFLKKQNAVFVSRPRTMATEHLSRGFLNTVVTPWRDQRKKMRRVVTSEIVSHARLKRLFVPKFSSAKTTKDHTMGVLNKYHDPVIKERDQQWSNGTMKNKVPEDLLDVLISLEDEQGKPLLSIEEIKAQAAELIIATVDNPYNSVEWTMAEMMNPPDILRKAAGEIDMVVGKSRWHLDSIQWPFNVPHVSTSDTVVSGYFIPKGSHVLLSRVGLGRNPRIWHEPLNFNPERHLMSNDGGIVDMDLTEQELRFISFTTGRRGYVGGALGTTIIVMLLARLIQEFHWSAPPGELTIDLTESANDLFLAKPLFVHAKQRLASHIYPAE
ncbi:hypothetical protein MKX01_027391 [Papaver californicum]|nr:hypothetical protein MKX01_027391 [Papaver californicum]